VMESDACVILSVKRVKGSDGTVGCSWATKEGSACSPSDFQAASGTLTFAPGVVEQTIKVGILDDGRYERDEDFMVLLTEPTGGVKFSSEGDGNEERQVCTVTIKSDDQRAALVDSVTSSLDLNVDSIALSAASWRGQFLEAFALEDLSPASIFFYLLSLPWKLAFALVPPPRLCGGWLCFFVGLAGIGCLTALIGDLADIMGCCMGLAPSITAITFVALGTSLPDTFASKSAAEKEPYADNSIGNVTGSNSVNVFLGLGLPWASAAFFWGYYATPEHEAEWRETYSGEPWYTPDMPIGFAVPAGDLAFSVMVFSTCAVITILTLVGRRALLGYELGGPVGIKYGCAAFLIGLWFVYISFSVANVYGWF